VSYQKGFGHENLLHPDLLPALAWLIARAAASCSRYSCDSSNLRTHRTSSLSLQSCSEKHSVKPRSKAPRNSALRHGKNGHRADQQVEIAIAVALPLPLPDSIKRAANLEAAAPASVGVSASLTPDAEFGAAHSGFGLCPQWFGRGRPLSRFSAAFRPVSEGGVAALHLYLLHHFPVPQNIPVRPAKPTNS
jgi:hypothetical protein